MPVDPRVGRMILAAEENGVLPEVLVIAAALSRAELAPLKKRVDACEREIDKIGKDIARFHAVIWPAMLAAAPLNAARRVIPSQMLIAGC